MDRWKVRVCLCSLLLCSGWFYTVREADAVGGFAKGSKTWRSSKHSFSSWGERLSKRRWFANEPHRESNASVNTGRLSTTKRRSLEKKFALTLAEWKESKRLLDRQGSFVGPILLTCVGGLVFLYSNFILSDGMFGLAQRWPLIDRLLIGGSALILSLGLLTVGILWWVWLVGRRRPYARRVRFLRRQLQLLEDKIEYRRKSTTSQWQERRHWSRLAQGGSPLVVPVYRGVF